MGYNAFDPNAAKRAAANAAKRADATAGGAPASNQTTGALAQQLAAVGGATGGAGPLPLAGPTTPAAGPTYGQRTDNPAPGAVDPSGKPLTTPGAPGGLKPTDIPPTNALDITQKNVLGSGGSGDGAGKVPPPPLSQEEQLYQDQMSGLDKQWGQQQSTLQNEMAGFRRQADSLNARMGGSIAGGYAGLAGSALGQGMDSYNKAANDYQSKRMDTMRQWATRQQDISDRNKQYDLDMAGLELQYSDTPGSKAIFDSLGGGAVGADGKPTNSTRQEDSTTIDRRANITKWTAELEKLKQEIAADPYNNTPGPNSTQGKRLQMQELQRYIDRTNRDIETNHERR